MAKFKVGDRVRLTEDNGGYGNKGDTATIIDPDDVSCFVRFDREIEGDTHWYATSSKLEPAPLFAVGDKVRWNGENGRYFTSGGVYEIARLAGSDHFVLTDNDQPSAENAKHPTDYEWLAANFTLEPAATAAKFKVGDRVRVVRIRRSGVPESEIGKEFTITTEDGWGGVPGGAGDASETPHWWREDEIEHATLTIRAGRYYKTRDGGKVGPMREYGFGHFDWSDESNDLFRPDGTGIENYDLIAEWPTTTTATSNAAAQVDNLRDEYGPFVGSNDNAPKLDQLTLTVAADTDDTEAALDRVIAKLERIAELQAELGLRAA